MNRRTLYIVAFLLFIPLILWYASGFSGVPEVTFKQAEMMADSVSKVVVPGRLAMNHEIKADPGGAIFFMQDNSGEVKRVVYDGSEELTPEDLNAALDARRFIQVAGHICSDGEGLRFHAKNVYLD